MTPSAAPSSAAWPPQIANISAWGMDPSRTAPYVRPRCAEELSSVLDRARDAGLSITCRGAGQSYGDASLPHAAGLCLDLTGLRKVHAFDPQSGVVRADPGVTIEDLWREHLPQGFWPPVVSGTMRPTLGGALGMNIHGKNAFKAGTIGRHVRAFTLQLASGEERRVTQESDAELFHSAIGGFGMLGVITEVELALRPVATGLLDVDALASPNLREAIATLEERSATDDYLVGWVDAFGGGRTLIHAARYVEAAALAEGADTQRKATDQDLPSRLFGCVPKGWLWPGLWCALNPVGMRAVNAAKYHLGARAAAKAKSYRQSLVGFSFLLDYVPRWKWAYRPGRLVQYQSFVPKAQAAATFEALLAEAQRSGPMPYLGVLKKHLPEAFRLTHACDGFSLALDFPARRGRDPRLEALAERMNRIVAQAGGRFYFAKDALLDAATAHEVFGAAEVDAFGALKARLDPEGRMESALARRLFPDWWS